MKRTWDIEELIEHFTLVPPELELLGNKSGATRLGFALLLKCFQLEGRFPTAKRPLRPADEIYNAKPHVRTEVLRSVLALCRLAPLEAANP